jgi:general L-amino acid transport system substrate-binding protein
MKYGWFSIVMASMFLGSLAPANAQTTLKTIKERGVLSCGVSQGLPGFPRPTTPASGAASMSIFAARWRLLS